jgi:hypothetical protein
VSLDSQAPHFCWSVVQHDQRRDACVRWRPKAPRQDAVGWVLSRIPDIKTRTTYRRKGKCHPRTRGPFPNLTHLPPAVRDHHPEVRVVPDLVATHYLFPSVRPVFRAHNTTSCRNHRRVRPCPRFTTEEPVSRTDEFRPSSRAPPRGGSRGRRRGARPARRRGRRTPFRKSSQ